MNMQWVKKLRLSEEMSGVIINAPHASYEEQLSLAGAKRCQVIKRADATLDEAAHSQQFIILFVKSLQELAELGPLAIEWIEPDGLLWICYPKGTSKIKTDINRDTGWQLLKTMGLEGVALISLDDTWSAMRYRPEGLSGKTRRTSTRVSSVSTSKQPVVEEEVPQGLQEALCGSTAASDFFQTLTPAMRRDFIRWIVDAKREETRKRRIALTIEKLMNGEKRPN